MRGLTIRDAVADDRSAVAEVDASAVATLRETYRPKRSAVGRKERMAVELTRLVASFANEIIATMQYMLEDDRLHVLSLGVRANFRRRGVARRLIADLENRAARLNCARLSLYTIAETGNEPLFCSLGFQAIRRVTTDDFESTQHPVLTETYMEKRL